MPGYKWSDFEDDEGFPELSTLLAKALMTTGILPKDINEKLTKKGSILATTVSKKNPYGIRMKGRQIYWYINHIKRVNSKHVGTYKFEDFQALRVTRGQNSSITIEDMKIFQEKWSTCIKLMNPKDRPKMNQKEFYFHRQWSKCPQMKPWVDKWDTMGNGDKRRCFRWMWKVQKNYINRIEAKAI